MSGDNSSVASGSSYPALDATSPTDSVIAGDFGSLSAQEQERQRDEWKAELSKTEEEIITLRQVRNYKIYIRILTENLIKVSVKIVGM